MTPAAFLLYATNLSFVIIVISLILGFIRLIKGPTMNDRVVALDMMTITIMAFCGLYTIFTGEAAFIDIGVVLALVGFLTTLALARFAERRRSRMKEPEA